jgi:hypothetical protein
MMGRLGCLTLASRNPEDVGGPEGFAFVVDVVTQDFDTAANAHEVALPPAEVGDLYVVFFATIGDDLVTVDEESGSWVFAQNPNTTAATHVRAAYAAKAAEGDDVLIFNVAGAGSRASAQVYVIRDWGGLEANTTVDVAATTAWNLPALSPSAGSAKYLFLAFIASSAGTSWTPPANYEEALSEGAGSAPFTHTAIRYLEAASDDPAAATNTSASYSGWIISIDPVA